MPRISGSLFKLWITFMFKNVVFDVKEFALRLVCPPPLPPLRLKPSSSAVSPFKPNVLDDMVAATVIKAIKMYIFMYKSLFIALFFHF